jgi:hypothetical protein
MGAAAVGGCFIWRVFSPLSGDCLRVGVAGFSPCSLRHGPQRSRAALRAAAGGCGRQLAGLCRSCRVRGAVCFDAAWVGSWERSLQRARARKEPGKAAGRRRRGRVAEAGRCGGWEEGGGCGLGVLVLMGAVRAWRLSVQCVCCVSAVCLLCVCSVSVVCLQRMCFGRARCGSGGARAGAGEEVCMKQYSFEILCVLAGVCCCWTFLSTSLAIASRVFCASCVCVVDEG